MLLRAVEPLRRLFSMATNVLARDQRFEIVQLTLANLDPSGVWRDPQGTAGQVVWKSIRFGVSIVYFPGTGSVVAQGVPTRVNFFSQQFSAASAANAEQVEPDAEP